MILDKLIELICEELGIDGVDETTALGSLVEDEFDIEIPDSEIENIRTIGELVEYIETNM